MVSALTVTDPGICTTSTWFRLSDRRISLGSDFADEACCARFGLLGMTGGTSRVLPLAAAGFRGDVDGGLIGLTGGFLTKGTVLKFCSGLVDKVGVVDRLGSDLKRPLLLLPLLFGTTLLLLLLLGEVLRFFWSLILLVVGVLASILFLATGPRSHCGGGGGSCSISFCCIAGGVGGEFPSPLLQEELSWLTVRR